jgi:hypothetical protein
VYWIPGYPNPPAPGPLQLPIFIDKEREATFVPAEKTLVRRRLTRKMTLEYRRLEDLLRRPSCKGWRPSPFPGAITRSWKDKTRKKAHRPCCWWPTSIGDRNSLRGKYYPNLLIWHKGSQRIDVSLNRWVVNSAAPGNSLARSGLSVATVL